jgi:hypothetical protein
LAAQTQVLAFVAPPAPAAKSLGVASGADAPLYTRQISRRAEFCDRFSFKLSGDRLQKIHDAFEFQIFFYAKFLGIAIHNGVCGLITRYFDLEGKEEFNRLSEREKRTQTTVPDLVSSHHPAGLDIFTSSPQM